MKSRMIIIGIEDICNLFRDYCGLVGFPDDGVPVRLLLNPQERKLAIVVEAPSFNGDQGMEEVKFDIRRIYGVGGAN